MFDVLVRDVAPTLEAATESVRKDFQDQGAESVSIQLIGYGQFLVTVDNGQRYIYEWRGNVVTLIEE